MATAARPRPLNWAPPQVSRWMPAVISSLPSLPRATANGGVIREVNHATGVITTVAGNGATGLMVTAGQPPPPILGDPYGVTVDAYGDLFIADISTAIVRRVEHESLSVTVSQAVPTLSVNDPGGTYDGSPFAAIASVSGVVSGVNTTPANSLEGAKPTITYYVGGSVERHRIGHSPDAPAPTRWSPLTRGAQTTPRPRAAR